MHPRKRKGPPRQRSGFSLSNGTPSGVGKFQAAFFTRPARMQEVQTRTCLRTPWMTALTRRKFGFQRRRVTLWAWLIVLPKLGFLPQISHAIAIADTPENQF